MPLDSRGSYRAREEHQYSEQDAVSANRRARGGRSLAQARRHVIAKLPARRATCRCQAADRRNAAQAHFDRPFEHSTVRILDRLEGSLRNSPRAGTIRALWAEGLAELAAHDGPTRTVGQRVWRSDLQPGNATLRFAEMTGNSGRTRLVKIGR